MNNDRSKHNNRARDIIICRTVQVPGRLAYVAYRRVIQVSLACWSKHRVIEATISWYR